MCVCVHLSNELSSVRCSRVSGSVGNVGINSILMGIFGIRKFSDENCILYLDNV